MRISLVATNIVCASIVLAVLVIPRLGAAQAVSDPVIQRVAEYHVAINNEANQHLMGLNDVLEEVKSSQSKTFTAEIRARFGEVSVGECLDPEKLRNISVNCLQARIENHRTKILNPALKQAQDAAASGFTDSAALLTNDSERRAAIRELNKQAEAAQRYILDAYSQIVLSNLLHTEFSFTAGKIESLNEVLEDFEDQLRWLPLKFVDISTAQCR